MRVSLFTDGGVRTGRKGGQKGRGSAGFCIRDEEGNILRRGGLRLEGDVTVNEAEYSAVILGLYNARMMGATEVDLFSDSMLIVTQINGHAECKAANLKDYLEEARDEIAEFERVEVEWIPREENQVADYETRRVLDAG